MRIEDPTIYFGKKIRVIGTDESVTIGKLIGYDYDFDDAGKEFLEIDVDEDDGVGYSFTEDEIKSIEIL